MIPTNTQLQNQFIAWIAFHNTFVYIPQDYLSGQYRECYLHFKDQYECVGKIDASALPDKFNELIYSCADLAIPKNYEVLISELAVEYRRRQAHDEALRLIQRLSGKNKFDESIVSHCEKLSNIMLGSTENKYNHVSSIDLWLSNIEERKNHPGALKGESTNLHALDYIIRGWQRGKMYVIGGLKKTGKSRFFLNLISSWLARGLRGIVFSMEMNESDIHTCIIANRLNINTSKIGTAELSDTQMESIRAEAQTYKGQQLIIDRRSALRIIDIKNLITRHKPFFVVVDYIQRMTGEGEKRAQQVEYCATRLADIARDSDTCMIVLSQLSGRAEHDTSSPIYAFFKESQAIIEACDCALVLYDEKRGEEKSPNGHILKCKILQREGMSDLECDLYAELKYARYSNVDNKRKEQIDVEDWIP